MYAPSCREESLSEQKVFVSPRDQLEKRIDLFEYCLRFGIAKIKEK